MLFTDQQGLEINLLLNQKFIKFIFSINKGKMLSWTFFFSKCGQDNYPDHLTDAPNYLVPYTTNLP